MTPQRIQRRRSKGWRLPPNTTCVSRPSRWGNPFRIGGYFRIGDHNPKPPGRFLWMERIIWSPEDVDDALASGFTLVADQAQAVQMFEALMHRSPWDCSPLAGRNLACWCKPGTPCHADILLRLANPEI